MNPFDNVRFNPVQFIPRDKVLPSYDRKHLPTPETLVRSQELLDLELPHIPNMTYREARVRMCLNYEMSRLHLHNAKLHHEKHGDGGEQAMGDNYHVALYRLSRILGQEYCKHCQQLSHKGEQES